MISCVIARSVRYASYFDTLSGIEEQAFQINRIKRVVVAWLFTDFGDLKIVSDLDDCSRPCASLLCHQIELMSQEIVLELLNNTN